MHGIGPLVQAQTRSWRRGFPRCCGSASHHRTCCPQLEDDHADENARRSDHEDHRVQRAPDEREGDERQAGSDPCSQLTHRQALGARRLYDRDEREVEGGSPRERPASSSVQLRGRRLLDRERDSRAHRRQRRHDLNRERRDREHRQEHHPSEHDVVGVETVGVGAEALPGDEHGQIESGEGREAAEAVVEDELVRELRDRDHEDEVKEQLQVGCVPSVALLSVRSRGGRRSRCSSSRSKTAMRE